MANPRPNNSTHDTASTNSVEMPRPTVWPIVLGLGVTMLALGVATSLAFCVVGGVLLLFGILGWISQLLPGRGHEHEELAEAAAQAKPVTARLGTVQQLKPGVVGYRFQLPEKVHPVSAGLKGGILGGLLMPIPALIWALVNHHSPWFPVNLLAGMVLPGLPDMPIDELHKNLEMFHPGGLLCGIVMHATMSIGFGLIGGVLLPTLPPIFGGPLLFGGVILPLLWSGASHSLMRLVNPLLNDFIDWRWYVASQLVYGITTSIVIIRSEKIAIAPRGPGGDAGGPSIPSGWLGCLLAMFVLFTGCSRGLDNLPGKPTKADAFVLPQDVKDFHQLYAQRCAGCHGANGTLGPGPPLNDAMFVALESNDELQHVIAAGRDGTLMPAWSHSAGGPLTDEQVSILATGIKQRQWSRNESGVDESGISSPRTFPEPPPLTAPSGIKGSIANGEKVFAMACESCHGTNGSGTNEGGNLHNHAFLLLSSDQILRRYIITGRHDLSMPDYAEKTGRGKDFQPLSAQQVSDLVALLASWRNEPSETVVQDSSNHP